MVFVDRWSSFLGHFNKIYEGFVLNIGCLRRPMVFVSRGLHLQVSLYALFSIQQDTEIDVLPNLFAAYKQMLEDGQFSDATIVSKDQTIPVHKAVLAVRCPAILQVISFFIRFKGWPQ